MRKTISLSAGLLVALSVATFAQTRVFPQPPSQPVDFSVAPDSAVSNAFERQLQTERAQKRQMTLKRDTDKLMELASQLKENVDKTNANILSVDVIKKAEQIEKLAKSVKEKMKGD